MRILILGAGGTGGYFGGRLVAAGRDVRFLVRPRRAEQLGRDGLRVDSPFGQLQLPVACVTDAGAAGPVDLVLLSCKAFDLEDAIRAIGPALGPETVVLPLLNGLRHLETLDAAFGAGRVLGGYCHLAVTLADDGSIRHLNRTHRLAVGSRSPAQHDVARRVHAGLDGAGFDAWWSEDIRREMWEKFAFLCSLAGMTCLARASVGEIVGTPNGERLMRELLAGCVAVARAEGVEPTETWRTPTERFLTDAASPLTASMLRDLEKGGRTEAVHIVGDMLERAGRAGVDLPTLAAAYVPLAVHEQRLACGKPG